ncbi:MAG: alpha/beta hydrolase [Deltaproteobacteria bacterium]|nr:MAG: alpha/beta hydrolase [Deltaproteobacteria bacterium]
MVPGIEQRYFTAPDGTRIGYQVRGAGPAVVLANGLGGIYKAFVHVYDALGTEYRVLCWDYRGLATSQRPRDLSTLSVGHQVEDLLGILDAEGIDRAVCVGWSMGVQVAFELVRRAAGRVAGIVAINGTCGRPFDSALSSRAMRYVIPQLLRAIRAQRALVGAATRRAVDWDGAVPLLQRAGLVSRSLDVDAFRAVAATFRDVDWDVYTRLMERLGEHDACDVLPSVRVPVLIITGDRDVLTPVSTAERIHRAVRGSRLVVIEGGTHYTPVEYPSIIQDELRRFLQRVGGWEPAAREGAD